MMKSSILSKMEQLIGLNKKTTNLLMSLVLVFSYGCNQPKSEIISRFENGNVKIERVVKNGEWTMEIHYYENGNIQNVYEIMDSVYHGNSLAFYPEGQLSAEGRFFKGVLNGKVTFFHNTGDTAKILLYENDSVYQNIDFYRTGQRFMSSYEKKGYVVWYRNGKKKSEVDFSDYVLIEYYQSGNLKRRGRIDSLGSKQKVGTWQFWDSTGVLTKEITYKGGSPIDSVLFIK